jgi:hypothetical protein
MTTFKIGDIVIARCTRSGIRQGWDYIVTCVTPNDFIHFQDDNGVTRTRPADEFKLYISPSTKAEKLLEAVKFNAIRLAELTAPNDDDLVIINFLNDILNQAGFSIITEITYTAEIVEV